MKKHSINRNSPSKRQLNAKLSCLILSIGLLGLSAQPEASDEGVAPAPSNARQKTGETTLVSKSSDGKPGNKDSFFSSISSNGRYVVFYSNATNLVLPDTNEDADIFVHDRLTGKISRVSVASDKTQGNSRSFDPEISADGRYVVFESDASNLVPEDTNGARDIFVHDWQTGKTIRVSVASNGEQGNGESRVSDISAEGRYVMFRSEASNLVPEDTNGAIDFFVHDRQTGETNRVSVASDGTQGDGDSHVGAISADGRYVAFDSESGNLVPEDTNGATTSSSMTG